MCQSYKIVLVCSFALSKKYMKYFLAIIFSFIFSFQAQATEVRVAVASNFVLVLNVLAEQFQQSSGHKIKISSGASGKFVAQIQYGAPFDVFFSADQNKVQVLSQRGLTVPNSQFTYALGSLVLWSAKEALLNHKNYRQILQSGMFNKLALANPKLAPYGLAAIQTLDRLGLRSSTQAKWVQGENIAQTYQFVNSGNADLGFVALSQTLQQSLKTKGSIWRVPSELHAPIRQDVVLLKRGKNNDAAQAFLEFIQTDQARAIIHSFGYSLP